MIYIIDDFLDKDLFKILENKANKFSKINIQDRTFWLKSASKEFISLMEDKLSEIEGSKINNILCFFREAKKGQDNEWRIHNDTYMNGQLPDKAIVFHIKCPNEKGLNGTALWEHVKHGDVYKDQKNTEEFNRLLKKDANNKNKWNLKSIIGAKPNRLLSYPSDYFHSKYPNEFMGQRVVFVMFYKINN